MEQTERTLQSPGEESAALPQAGMRERNAHYLSLATPGFCPVQEANSGIRRREGRSKRMSYVRAAVEPRLGHVKYE